jgi:hypothetical protein
MKVIAAVTMMGLVSTLGFLTVLHVQFAFAASLIESLLNPNFDIQSGNSSGSIVCDPICHISNNNGGSSGGSSITDAQPAYRLTVNVPSQSSDTSTVGISITTENGYTHEADLSGAGDLSYAFNIPQNQGKSVQVCVKPGNLSIKNCRTYETTGSDMSVSLPAVSSTSPVRNIGPSSGWEGYRGYYPGFYGYP